MKINVFLTWQPQQFWKLNTSLPHVFKIQLHTIWGWQSCVLRGIMSPVSEVVTTPKLQNKSFVFYCSLASQRLHVQLLTPSCWGGRWPRPGTALGKPSENPRHPSHAWVPHASHPHHVDGARWSQLPEQGQNWFGWALASELPGSETELGSGQWELCGDSSPLKKLLYVLQLMF